MSTLAFNLPPILLDIPRNAVLAIGMPLVLGTLSGLPTAKVVNGPWYKNLKSPALKPPNRAFGIVWPILYSAMGYASHLAVKAYDSGVTPETRAGALSGLKLYYIQLGLNLVWTPLFFGAKQKGLALVDIVTLTGIVIWMTATLNDPTDGHTTLFLVPYCMWLTFATYLNTSFWYQNRGQPELKQT